MLLGRHAVQPYRGREDDGPFFFQTELVEEPLVSDDRRLGDFEHLVQQPLSTAVEAAPANDPIRVPALSAFPVDYGCGY